jgi:uncharacterized protein (TIGR03118 family)
MQRSFTRTLTLSLALGFALMFVSGAAFAQYTGVILDSNLAGKGQHTDPLLVNPWGLAYGPTTAFWVSDEGSGWSTLYDGSGNPQSLQVIVPSANGNGVGSPTGIVYNGSQEFQIDSWPSAFIFATLDGTIQGWSHFDPSTTLIGVNNSSSGASYTGLAVTSKSSGNTLFAANFNSGMVEMYNATFQLIGTFRDPILPKGVVPFGIQDINGQVYVAWARADEGPGGLIDIYTETGTLVKHLTSDSHLNQPWGIAMAPSNFGPLSNTLLVSNNTNAGTINGFNPTTGKYVGTVTQNGKPIVITQLWGIEFGGGSSLNGQTNQLFVTAGPPANNSDGYFGYIQAK